MKSIFRLFNYFFIGVSYLASKKIVVILVLVLFICLLQVSVAYQTEFSEQEHELFYEKENIDVEYYNADVDALDFDDNMAIMDVMECYQKGIDFEDIPDSIKTYIHNLKILYDEDSRYFSFLYQDIFSGFTVSYNADAPIFTASAIKAPAMIYLYEKASLGEVDLNEKLTYRVNDYNGGSGVLKTKPFNTTYSIDELVQYTIDVSDNIAYAMLMERFGRQEMLNFWHNMGTQYIFTYDTIWGVMSANDAAIYMRELYRFSKDNEEYGTKLFDYFKGSEWKLIFDGDGEYNTASKGGWSGEAIHDVAIVFDENPYILVIMTNMGESNYRDVFDKTSEMVSLLHEEYWKYKATVCSEIKIY